MASWPHAGLAPFPAQIPSAPAASSAAASYLATKAASKRPTGTYRPPGARGQGTPDIYKRIDEGGSGASTPDLARSGSQQNGTYQAPGSGNRKRAIPGAPGSAPRNNNGGNAANQKDGKKKGGKQNGKNAAASAPAVVTVTEDVAALSVSGAAEVGGNSSAANQEKKVRNLNKKLKAIEELKMRQAGGEKLEAMQLAKIAARRR